MRTRRPLIFFTTVLALASVEGCRSGSGSASQGDIPDVALPAVTDSTIRSNDSTIAEDRRAFFCGSLSGAFTAKLVCNRVYPNLNWVVAPGGAAITIRATEAYVDAGSTPVFGSSLLAFQILTPARISPLAETCATLPPPIAGSFKAPFVASFAPGNIIAWSGACGSATQVLSGTSFELVVTSPGMLTSDSAGSDSLDASADAYDWANVSSAVLSNSFHGTLNLDFAPSVWRPG